MNPVFPPLLLMTPLTNNNEALFQLAHAPVGGKVLFNHLKYHTVLQVGIHVAISLMGVFDVLLGTPGVSLDRICLRRRTELKLKFLRKLFDNNNILCLREVHGKDEHLQAIQVLAPRFQFFGTFVFC